MDLDEVDLAILDLYELADEAGVSITQARIMLRERVDIAAEIIDALTDDWPDVPMPSTAIH